MNSVAIVVVVVVVVIVVVVGVSGRRFGPRMAVRRATGEIVWRRAASAAAAAVVAVIVGSEPIGRWGRGRDDLLRSVRLPAW